MSTTACTDCVTREECNNRHQGVTQILETHEGRLNQKDVSDAKRDGIAEVQTKLLWGILTVGLGSFLVSLFAPVLTHL